MTISGTSIPVSGSVGPCDCVAAGVAPAAGVAAVDDGVVGVALVAGVLVEARTTTVPFMNGWIVQM